MKRASLSYLLLAAWGLTLAPGSVLADAPTAFERIKQLVGEWSGTFEWTGHRSGGGPIKATYYVSGAGSAVVENLIADGEVEMTTVYHLDGDELRATHYCAAGNQPRFKAARALQGDVLTFQFEDITNLTGPTAPHVHGLTLRFEDGDHLTVKFTLQHDGKESFETVTLTRASALR